MQINSKTPTKRILKAVRKVIEDSSGLSKMSYFDQGCYCTLGAVNLVCNGDPNTHNSREAERVRKVLALSLPWDDTPMNPYLAISEFNDHPMTTKADVLAVLDRAIRHA